MKLRIGLREEDNPGHRPLITRLGHSLSLWKFERGPFTPEEIIESGGNVIQQARRSIGEQVSRWAKDQRCHQAAEKIILADDRCVTVIRYVLAVGNASLGRYKKQKMALTARGERDQVVGKYLELVRGGWTEGDCAEDVARALVDTLLGAHRIHPYSGFAEVLDLVKLLRPCPKCGEHLAFIGWMTSAWAKIPVTTDDGDLLYYIWANAPPTVAAA